MYSYSMAKIEMYYVKGDQVVNAILKSLEPYWLAKKSIHIPVFLMYSYSVTKKINLFRSEFYKEPISSLVWKIT